MNILGRRRVDLLAVLNEEVRAKGCPASIVVAAHGSHCGLTIALMSRALDKER